MTDQQAIAAVRELGDVPPEVAAAYALGYAMGAQGTSADSSSSDTEAGELTALNAAIDAWLAWDKNPVTVKQAVEMKARGDAEELGAAFGKRMAFGTAGLRAPMGTGIGCMNELTVLQASQGLCQYMLSCSAAAADSLSVVIGYDGRATGGSDAGLNSKSFAMRTAAAFLQKGVQVHLFEDFVPTPYVAHAVTHLGCAAGIMVTASHNPKEDNGYKVYWANGAQIISPHDVGISDSIQENLEPWGEAWDDAYVTSHPKCSDPTEGCVAKYMSDLLDVSRATHSYGSEPSAEAKSKPQAKIVYTAMHGVGYKAIQLAFATAGLQPVVPVPEQVEPDPEFPTVRYPNPEEGKGALLLAFAAAEAAGSSVVLANDPDADRLAVACKHEGEWRIFKGNEIGAIFGWWAWETYKASAPEGADHSRVAMLSSTVSSFVLQSIAKKEGFYFEDTLTGFKWMGNKARELEASDPPYKILLSYEEAIGFAHGSAVVDKDGVSAAVVMAELVNHLTIEGKTLVDCLHNVYAQYGYHATKGSYFICKSQPTIDKIFGAIRKDGNYPTKVGEVDIVHVRDLTTGYDSSKPGNKATLPTQSSNMITFYLSNDSIVTLRTSGTEPKIKYYSEMIGKANTPEERALLEQKLGVTVDLLVQNMLQPDVYGLEAKKEA